MDPTFWQLLVVLVLTGVLFGLMPRLTRPDVFFAVTIDPAFRRSPQGVRAVRVYRAGTVASSVLAAAVLFVTSLLEAAAPWMVLALVVQLLGSTASFVAVRQRVLPHAAPPAATREAVVAVRRTRLPGGWLLQVLPFLVLLVVAGLLAVRWEDLPAQLPVHWSLNGQPDRWADRSGGSVFAPLASAVLVCALLLGAAIALLHGRHVTVEGAAARREDRFRRLTVVALLVAQLMIALSATRQALFVLLGPGRWNDGFTALVVAGLLATIALVVMLVRLGQGGSGGIEPPAGAAPIGDRTPDSAWKWGLIYVNRDDPAFLVEKRFGVGYTFNFGHPATWVALALLVGVPIAIAILAR